MSFSQIFENRTAQRRRELVRLLRIATDGELNQQEVVELETLGGSLAITPDAMLSFFDAVGLLRHGSIEERVEQLKRQADGARERRIKEERKFVDELGRAMGQMQRSTIGSASYRKAQQAHTDAQARQKAATAPFIEAENAASQKLEAFCRQQKHNQALLDNCPAWLRAAASGE